jgi:ParB family transcriptional regulator, chromosome partitioning protein
MRELRLPLGMLQPRQRKPAAVSDAQSDTPQELIDSIKSHGVLAPIVIRVLAPAAGGAPQLYEIVDGERRWRAAQIAALAEIPCLLEDMADSDVVVLHLVENMGRDHLTQADKAASIHSLMQEFGLTREEAERAES